MKTKHPIAENLWSQTDEPQLIAGRKPDGTIIFPIPEGKSGADFEPCHLNRKGTLWSWTCQNFRPKLPYDGPKEFTSFLLGYVEIPGQLIVETRIVGASFEELKLGLPMELVIIPFDEDRSTYAFKPEKADG